MNPRRITEQARAPIAGGVCAIVVTRQRRELLATCLEHLQRLDRAAEEILVVDNASTDGSHEMVRERFPNVHVLRLEENLGGAGGFHRGLQWAHSRGHEWLWVMDDDSFVAPDSLEALLAGAARAPAGRTPLVLASRVLWKDERLHPMNEPWPRWRWRREMIEGVAEGLLLLRHATFVSAAIHRDAVDRFGLPLEHYFIWTDDFEYTGRILRSEPGYMVPESVVWHWTERPHSPVTATDDRFYYFVRNSLLLMRGTSLLPAERLQYLRMYVRSLGRYVRRRRLRPAAVVTVARGVRAGLRDPVR